MVWDSGKQSPSSCREAERDADRDTAHTPLPAALPEVSGWWAGAWPYWGTRGTCLQPHPFDVQCPQGQPQRAHNVPFASQLSPIQPAHPRVCRATLVILHPSSLHPVAFLPHPALLSAPPRAAPLLHQLLQKTRLHSSSLPGSTSRTWFWTPGLCPDSLSTSQLQDPLGHCCKSPFLSRSCSRAVFAVALQKQ